LLRGRIDLGARLIRIFEKLGWVKDVRWPHPVRLAATRADASPKPRR
jgi:stearoyl-CoA desaturase (delta-9 desaturase)